MLAGGTPRRGVSAGVESSDSGEYMWMIATRSMFLAAMLGTAWHGIAQDAKTLYPSMAPIEQYLMDDRGTEVALARSAAPESISRDAEVLILGRHGYETAVKGERTVSCAW